MAKAGTDFKKDVRPMNQSGIYAEKDAQTWKDMAKSGEGKDTEWCGTPSDESCEIVGAPTGASKHTAERTGGTGEETAPAGHAGPALARRAMGQEPQGRWKGDGRDRGRAGNLRAALAR